MASPESRAHVPADKQNVYDMLALLGTNARRVIGAAVAVLAVVPAYNLLAHPDTGRAGWVTGELLTVYADLVWAGTLMVLAAAIGAGRFVPADSGDRLLHRMASVIKSIRPLPFAIGAAFLAGILTAVFSWLALDAKPNMIDAMAQALHARFLAEGRWAGPASDWNAFWHIQNSVITEHGWVSQYPPGHVLLLAGAMAIGLPWLLGPVMVAITVFFTALIAERAFADDPVTARLGVGLTALSPFLICIGASYLNHVPALALLSITTYMVMRASEGDWRWAIGAGFTAGLAVTMRPLTALAIAVVVALAAWLTLRDGTRAIRRVFHLGAAATLGAALPLACMAVYNAHFFGSPLTFGYNVALGPRMGLGFGVDPWGNAYGLREAIGYTSSDLTALGVALLETPLSAVLVVGLLLAIVPRLTSGERVLAAWALVPVLANALYWHHGIYMGPRMLYEAGPAWVLLFARTSVRVVRSAPTRIAQFPKYSPRMAAAGGAIFMFLFGLAYLAPQRAASYGGGWLAVARIEPPRTESPALVFVHDAWTARLAMRLAANGMRLDSVETAIRQNPTCHVQRLVDVWERDGVKAARSLLESMDLEPRATRLPPIMGISIGNTIRIARDEKVRPECARQIYADRNGILDIAPLVWQGDLPGGAVRGSLFVRDLGPEANAALIARHPDRTPWMLYTPSDSAHPALVQYDEGVTRIWMVQDQDEPQKLPVGVGPSSLSSASQE